MQISGAAIIRNGVKLGYPFVESIKSILPICSEFIVCVGKSVDGTRDKIREINDQKIKIIDTIWDENKRLGGAILSEQTNVALSKCSGDWIFYIQSDEVVNEKDYDKIISAVSKAEKLHYIDGLIFNYLHFYGSYSTVQFGRNWYNKEVRMIKNFRNIVSVGDAQGFRKNGKKLQAIESGARMYHYGWARPPEIMVNKIKDFHKLWHNDEWIKKNCSSTEISDYFPDLGNLKKYIGDHPAVMRDLIKNDYSDFIKAAKNKYITNRKIKEIFRDFVKSVQIGRHRNFIIVKS